MGQCPLLQIFVSTLNYLQMINSKSCHRSTGLNYFQDYFSYNKLNQLTFILVMYKDTSTSETLDAMGRIILNSWPN